MADFILVDELSKTIREKSYSIKDNQDFGMTNTDIYEAIDSCKHYEFNEPPKKGKWLETHDTNKKRCSNCDFIFLIATYPACSADYCPHCGARMVKENERCGNCVFYERIFDGQQYCSICIMKNEEKKFNDGEFCKDYKES